MLKQFFNTFLIIVGFIVINPTISSAYDFWPGNFTWDWYHDGNEWWNFLSWELWLDLYKKIEKGYTQLQLKLYENEVKWWEVDKKIIESLAEKYKTLWEKDCINSDTDLSIAQFKKISDYWLLPKFNLVKDECKWDDWSIDNQTINQIVSTIKIIDQISQTKANAKAQKMEKIARIWLYSDWDTNNSPFDLVDDLKKIDEIIFTSEIPYEWVNMNNSDNSLSNLLSWENNNTEENNNSWNLDNNNIYTSWEQQPDLSEILWTNNPDSTNKVCQTNNSWLSDDTLEATWIWTWDINWCSPEWKKWINNCCDWLKLATVNWQKFCINNSKWTTIRCLYKNTEQEWYYYINWKSFWDLIEKTNCSKFDSNIDSNWWSLWAQWWWSDWPCNTFFCITIKFVTSQHNLLWWWKTKSIESIIARSNKHLKKNTSTSMIQAKMTINNFEIMLRDLDLAEKFNIWVNLSWKSPPILNLEEKEESTDDNIKKLIDNMLDIAYKENWMDYERSNDLQIFGKIQEENYCINNKWELSIKETDDCWYEINKITWEKVQLTKITKKQAKLIQQWNINIAEINYQKAIKKENVNSTIDSQIKWLTSDKFYKQYIQVNSFIDYLSEWYTPAVQTYIKSMFNDIPVWWG